MPAMMFDLDKLLNFITAELLLIYLSAHPKIKDAFDADPANPERVILILFSDGFACPHFVPLETKLDSICFHHGAELV